MKLIFLYILILTLLSFNSNSANIGTIKIDYILNNTNSFKIFLEELNKFKKENEKNFKQKEELLIIENKEIEESSIILNDDQINEKLILYKNKVDEFQNEINKYNLIINNNIDNNRSIIIKNIAQIAKNIAKDNNLQIILTDNDYFLSSDDIDISNKVITLINKKKIDLKLLIN